MKKDVILEEIFQERISENVKLFSKEELTIIENNSILMKKMYMLGLIDTI